MSEDKSNDLEILNPDQELTINGELVTVHEYRFMEGMHILPLAHGLLHDLGTLFMDEPDRATDLTVLTGVFADHWHVIPDLISKAVDRPREWVEQLSDEDGQMLLMIWWQVNASFFTRRLVAAAAARLGQQQAAASAGVESPPN